MRSSSPKSSRLTSRSSKAASITSWQSAEVGELGRQRQAAERGVLLVLGQPLLLDAAGEVVVDPLPRALAELGLDLAADDLEAGLQADLRDPGTHRAEPDHPDRERSPRRAIL